MNAPVSHASLAAYVRAVDALIERSIADAGYEPDQAALLLAGVAFKARRSARKPLSSHSLAPCYLTIRAHGLEVDEDAEVIGAGLMIYYFSLDLFDGVQDDELEGPYATVGPELAINCAIALLMLALDVLQRFVHTLPGGLGPRAAAMMRAHALRSIRGQHRDLVHRGREVTLADVRTTSIEKSALCAMRMELCGAYIAARTTPAASEIDPRFGVIGDAIAELRQMVNDVADLFDGDRSEDLRQGTMSMPLAMYVEAGGDEARATLRAAQMQQVGEREVQRRVYRAGVMARVAAQTEAVRTQVHEAFAGLPCGGPYLALLLAWLDDMPSIYYRPSPLRIAIDVDEADASMMSDEDRALLETLRGVRRARAQGGRRPAGPIAQPELMVP
ncbi:polyprenyl synthetase family protein [Paraliomyxa miuraensis]|uniref:polyprenyl synthetase family protein n=1 Tax=Paraliomyxa miuraensis TaxID=376150 RepID=UPI00225136E2|nr:polyprenyl synthetase family protein [Paraliomyxa miuraensis]MCX4247480.1 polyprenyl synthetase family protein [Paraliomyxa miuraensis]